MDLSGLLASIDIPKRSRDRRDHHTERMGYLDLSLTIQPCIFLYHKLRMLMKPRWTRTYPIDVNSGYYYNHFILKGNLHSSPLSKGEEKRQAGAFNY